MIVGVRLPLTDSVSYKTYYIWSGPIPGNSSNYNVQLQLAADVATHTLTGGIFQPTTCHSKSPWFVGQRPLITELVLNAPKEFLLGQSLSESDVE